MLWDFWMSCLVMYLCKFLCLILIFSAIFYRSLARSRLLLLNHDITVVPICCFFWWYIYKCVLAVRKFLNCVHKNVIEWAVICTKVFRDFSILRLRMNDLLKSAKNDNYKQPFKNNNPSLKLCLYDILKQTL